MFAALLVVYLLLTLAVIYQTPLLTFDGYLRGLHLKHNHHQWATFVTWYVAFGQRGPSTLVFLPFFIWMAWRKRSAQPLVLLVTALVLLNLSVGVVKVITGRVGPFGTTDTHAIFDGGNIYPSGHVSNTVVLYGLIAWIALEYRKTLVVVAVWLSVTVGLGTVYLRTHWISDVFAGWIAGALVLVALPWVMPTAERFVDAVIARIRARRGHRTKVPSQAAKVGPRHARTGSVAPGGRSRVRPTSANDHRKSTPVRSAARSQSFAATAASLDDREESTSSGDPRSSPIPSGP